MQKISIIIPVYNCEKYLEQCIRSAINQESEIYELEIIIVNDGSTDNSLNIINKFKNKCKIINQKNQGLSSARNTALNIVSGDFIFFLDSDDYLPDNAIKKLYQKIKKSNDDIVVGKIINFNSSKEYDYYTNKFLNNNSNLTYKINKHLLEMISVCGKLYRFKSVKDNRFIQNLIHEDNYYSLCNIISEKKYCLMNEIVYYRRIRDDENKSITQKLNLKTFQDLINNYYAVIKLYKVNYTINKILCKKIFNYILKFIDKNELSIALNDSNIFFKCIDIRSNLNNIQMFMLIIYRKMYIIAIRILFKLK